MAARRRDPRWTGASGFHVERKQPSQRVDQPAAQELRLASASPTSETEWRLKLPMADSFNELLARARDGEREAPETLFARLEPRVLAIVRRRLGAELRAEVESADIQQSVLKDAHRDLAKARGNDEDTLLGWIAGLVEHKLANKARDRRRLKRDAGKLVRLDATASDGGPAPEPAAAIDTPSVDATMRERLDQLRAALQRLPQRWREVFVLRAVQRLEWSEIAQRTGQTVKAAQSCYDRARIRLAAEHAE